jgi:hypothetical protein
MNLKELTKQIPYKWRKGPGSTQLAYIDARDVMDLLDEVAGQNNWQTDYKILGDKIYCGIGIFVDDKWVWKWDMGTESDFEAEKGEASDAFKRAGVKWGIGRFLYDIDPNKPTFSQVKSSAKKEIKKMTEDLDDLVLTDEMLGADSTQDATYCPVCGGHISQREVEYCKSKNLPVACYDCQKGTKLISQKPALDKVYASERKSK